MRSSLQGVRLALSAPFWVAALAASAAVDEPEIPAGPEPAVSSLEEQVGVRLVLLDTLVVDPAGRTVPDLASADFEIQVDGEFVPVDTLDVACSNPTDEPPQAVRRIHRRVPPPALARGRKLVLALDYFHVGQTTRVDVLEQAKEMLRVSLAPGDEVMIAALAGGLRVEQTFTPDVDRLVDTLDRMEYDITLWKESFPHLTEDAFFQSLEALFSVLESVPGRKALVLYSDSPGRADDNDLNFARLAGAAAVARCAIYPMPASGMPPPSPG